MYIRALFSFHYAYLSADPEDYSSATRYNVTFRQTAFTDGDDPAPTALSSPILINITYDDIFESVEYFQAHIVESSDRFTVRIGPQDTVNVAITDSESFISLGNFCSSLNFPFSLMAYFSSMPHVSQSVKT